MTKKTKNIRKAIATVLEPMIFKAGFAGKYPNYQRKLNGKLQILSIIYSKWGGELTLEFANTEPGDLKTDWGEIVLEKNIDIAYIYPGFRARLSPDGSADFFSYEKLYEDYDLCEELIVSIADKFSQIEDWLNNGNISANIRAYSLNSI